MWLLILSLANSSFDKWDLSRRSILREKIENSIFDSSFSPPYILLSLIRDDAHKDTKIYHTPSEGKGKRDKRGCHEEDRWEIEEPRFPYESMTTTGATNIRGFSKRTADSARLNENGKSVHRSEKAWRTGRCADINGRERVWIPWRPDHNSQDRWS